MPNQLLNCIRLVPDILASDDAFSRANYGEKDGVGGLPLGIDYTWQTAAFGIHHQLRKRVSVALQCGFYSYHEPTSGDATDFTARAIFAMLDVNLP